MGGTDITSSAVSGNTISISSVTGNVIITAVASEKEEEFNVTWELGNVDSTTGGDKSATTAIRTNYIPVKASKKYYFTNAYTTPTVTIEGSPVRVKQICMYAYDSSKQLIERMPGIGDTKYFYSCKDRTDITSNIMSISGVAYVRIRVQEWNFTDMTANFDTFTKAVKFEEE